MQCSRWLAAAILLGVSTTSCTTSHPRYECPASLREGDSSHAFAHIDVFDGPPQKMASLIPVAIKHGAQWEMTRKADTYLVCGYAGTQKTITVHAPDTSVCKTLDTPGTAAFCN